MRHQCRVPKLGRPTDQRKAMLRGLTTQLIREGRVTTTKARAKALRDEAERMITLAKNGSLASRRRAIGYIYDKQLVHALFDKAQDRYGDRQGGYTRIIRTVPRRGDNAPMVFIELVDREGETPAPKKEVQKKTAMKKETKPKLTEKKAVEKKESKENTRKKAEPKKSAAKKKEDKE